MLWWGASFRLLKEVKLAATVQGCAHTMYVVSRCCEVTRCCHPKEKKLDAGMGQTSFSSEVWWLGLCLLAM